MPRSLEYIFHFLPTDVTSLIEQHYAAIIIQDHYRQHMCRNSCRRSGWEQLQLYKHELRTNGTMSSSCYSRYAHEYVSAEYTEMYYFVTVSLS